MATSDLTRDIFEPRKQYRSLRLQQGRVLSDDDPNEAERIRLEDERRARLEIVGPYGSPDEGFRVGDPGLVDDAVDFRIGAGSLWVGGIRFEKSEAESYREQADWLTHPLSDSGEGGVPAPQDLRRDLVYVECWLQPVSAVEDAELFEVALGGPDTSTRLKAMCRVRVRPEVETGDCATAWTDLVDALEAEGRGSVNEEHELVVDTRLDVGFEDGENGDLCTPAVAEGYLGAENQAIRVELLDDERIVWGFDNGAPLYRARETADADDVVVLLTEPKDEAHRPRPGQVVELLPWGAVLVNGEKVADDLEPGFFAFVESYDPETGRLDLNRPLTAGDDFLERASRWRDRDDADELLRTRFGRDAIPGDEADLARFFVRVWDQGPARNGDGPGADDVPGLDLDGGPVSLAGTGLTVEVMGDDYRPGDHWIVSARPGSPDRVVPWELQRDDDGGRRPHGVRRFVAPLAVIEWNAGDEPGAHVVHDCRPPFRPLTETGGCCRFTVGDGVRSHGHFRSVQRAVDALPPEGGEICLLPGVHAASVVVDDRENIVIRGCGKQTRVIPAPRARSAPIFHVRDSRCVVLETMDLATFTGTAVVVESTDAGSLRDVAVRENRIHASERGVAVHGGTQIRIRENRIRILDAEDAGVGVYARATRCAIAENDVGVVPIDEEPPPVEEPDGDTLDPGDRCEDPERLYGSFDFLAGYLGWLWVLPLTELLEGRDEPAPFRALGGIQVAAGSVRTRVRRNRVVGGAGDGVKLGGALPAPAADGDGDREPLTVEHPGGLSFNGRVALASGEEVAGVEVVFTSTDDPDEEHAATTNADGTARTGTTAPAGEYAVAVSDPGYEVTAVEERGTDEFAHHVDITVREVDPPAADPLRPIIDVEVAGNRIRRMGLSGIGTEPVVTEPILTDAVDTTAALAVAPRQAGAASLGVPVLGLDVLDNRIRRCLQTPFDADRRGALGLRAARSVKGVGGISLGIASSVRIRENLVEENGTSAVDPVCGVFVGFAGGAEVSGNRIVENGPAGGEPVPDDVVDLDPGIRGGIVVRFAAPPWEAAPETTAASIADNTVSQPAGRAVAVHMAVGTLSIRGNRLEVAGRVETALEALSAAVWILNLGAAARLREPVTREGPAIAASLPYLPDAMLAGGSVDFSHNKVHVGRGPEARGTQLIASLDDVSYAANQTRALIPEMFFDGFLVGLTLRADGNRFREPEVWAAASDEPDAARVSLITLALVMNDTSHNEADFCIVPMGGVGASPVAEGNQELLSALWERDPCEILRNSLDV